MTTTEVLVLNGSLCALLDSALLHCSQRFEEKCARTIDSSRLQKVRDSTASIPQLLRLHLTSYSGGLSIAPCGLMSTCEFR